MNSNQLIDRLLAQLAIWHTQKANEEVSHNTSHATHTTGNDSARAPESSRNRTEDTTGTSQGSTEAADEWFQGFDGLWHRASSLTSPSSQS